MRRYSLTEISEPNWFSDLLEQNADLQKLSELLGERRVAMCVLCGVQITSIRVDPRTVGNGTVEVLAADGVSNEEHRISDLIRSIASHIVSLRDDSFEAIFGWSKEERPLSADELRSVLGQKTILLAPIFGIELQELRVQGQEVEVVYYGDDDEWVESYDEFVETLHQCVLNEALLEPDDPLEGIDRKVLPEVRLAMDKKDWNRCVELLSPWLGGLASIHRQHAFSSLDEDAQVDLIEGVASLGISLARTSQPVLADELLRLGAQWAANTDLAGQMYRLLGQASMEKGAYAEAIGLLIRSIRLSDDVPSVHLELGKCFRQTGRPVAAALCFQRAAELGIEDASNELMSLPQDVIDRWYALQRFLRDGSLTESSTNSRDT
ncbi:MAG: hypothetical protein R3A47_08500 [Polyangiales bacterium]